MTKRGSLKGPPKHIVPAGPYGLLELDRFTQKDLETWNERSEDLDELHQILHFDFARQRLKHKDQLMKALQAKPAGPFEFKRWVRIVTYEYSQAPLSAAGSLGSVGGRFNVGVDVDAENPWPALYIAEDAETAYREKYQLPQAAHVSGLTPAELALETATSTATVFLDGHLERVFNINDPYAVIRLCNVLKRMPMPAAVGPMLRRLKAAPNVVYNVKKPVDFRRAVLEQNWRVWPVQFGLPSPSQVLGQLLRDAGFEAVRFPSSKNGKQCLVVYPQNVDNVRSYVELADTCPEGVVHVRLDAESADELCGWDILPPSLRRRP